MDSQRSRAAVGLRAGVVVGAVALAASLIVSAGESRADRIVLRGGGQVKGKIVPDPKKADRVSVVLERGKTPMSVPKDRIVQVIEEASPLDGYVVRRASAPETAQGQFDLGLYCEQHHLPDLAELHFETALRLDKSFGPAHEKLGHMHIQGRWLSGDELRQAQGLVRHKGKWITPEEKAERDKETESAAEQSSWTKRVRLWRDALTYGADDRRREAEAQLLSLRDPAAVASLVKVLGDDQPAMRSLLAKTLGGIPGPEAASALVHRLLAEDEADVRGTVMDELTRRGKSEVNKPLVRALRATDPAVVNRAAWALANLNDVGSVPSLVGALVTTRTRMVLDPSGGGATGGSSFTVGFGSYPGALPPTLGPPIAYNGSTTAFLVGPVVAPGAVAYGAVGIPTPGGPPLYGYNPVAALTNGLTGTGMSTAGGLGASRGPVPRMISESFQNTEVHAALVKLTGEDFGYDLSAWRRWLRTSFQPDPAPAKSVPQP
jgi:hypothetical protein